MRPAARRLRRLAWSLLWLSALGLLLAWAWGRPFMASARMLWDVARAPPPTELPVPVQGVDIFAKRGTPVASATRGVVVAVREGGLGGRQVWVLGPGRERHYYAHLDDWAEGLATGRVVRPGDVLGYVGTTGNAQGTPPHLHYGIYGAQGAYDPLPLFRANASGAAQD